MDPALATSIGWCESHYRTAATNPNSSATGLFQFLIGTWYWYGNAHWGTWRGRTRWDAEDNAELAMRVMSTTGTRDWNASRWCWGPMYAAAKSTHVVASR